MNNDELEAYFSDLDSSDSGGDGSEASGDVAPQPLRKEPLRKEAWAEIFDPTQLRDRVVVQLLFNEKVQIEHIERAWRVWRKLQHEGKNEALWRILAQAPDVDREAVFAAAAESYAFQEVRASEEDMVAFMKGVADVFTEEQWDSMINLLALPVGLEEESHTEERKLILATNDPAQAELHRMLQGFNLKRFELRYAPESKLRDVVKTAFPKKNEYLERLSKDGLAFDFGLNYEQDTSTLVDEDALEAEISRSQLINLFEAMLVEGVRSGASDIHLFPNASKQVEIHFRVDGELSCWHIEKQVDPEAFLAVAKDNAMNVDRFERDAAQDGYIQRQIDHSLIRFRVSVLPIASAAHDIRSESIVIRILDDRKVITDLKQLGLQKVALERFDHAIRQPYGMVILTGPTGSGKTTTLYAALHHVVTPKLNVLTVEDPVEYILPGVRQIKLNHRLHLEGALRSILRHDPDVVMVGEMRDRETAELAIKLANTGHLTFSTLHTNDAPSAVSRLYKMGIEPFLIAYAINLVMAQRLMRVLCPACKMEDSRLDRALLERLGFSEEEVEETTFFTHSLDATCKECGGNGYKGRRAITETMLFTPAVSHIIVSTKDTINEDALREEAIKDGMHTLQMSARDLVKQGVTSIREMMRVVFTEL